KVGSKPTHASIRHPRLAVNKFLELLPENSAEFQPLGDGFGDLKIVPKVVPEKGFQNYTATDSLWKFSRLEKSLHLAAEESSEDDKSEAGTGTVAERDDLETERETLEEFLAMN